MKTVITIGRTFGSGGREIGEKIAEHFGIKCYDKELLIRAAKESGICEEVLFNHDERPTSSFLYNLVMDTYSFGYNSLSYIDMPVSHKVFIAQFDTIKRIASDGPCVIVGRCADYALQDFDNVLNLFIYASPEACIKRIMERFPNIKSKEEARQLINKKNKQRKSYYDYYSSNKWGYYETYDLMIDSSVLGVEGTVRFIAEYVKDFEGS